MSLDWDVREVAEEFKTDDEWPVTEALIWSTLSVGIPAITEATVEKFATRLNMVAQLYGPPLTVVDDDGRMRPQRITLTEVRQRIGLRTNVSRLSDAAFKTRMYKRLEEQASAQVVADRRLEAEAEAEANTTTP